MIDRRDLPNFKAYCEDACTRLWGKPDKRNPRELRWDGPDAYSVKTFSLKKRSWYDHGAGWGGSTLDLVAYDKGLPKQDLKGKAFFETWAAAHEMGIVPDEPPAAPNGKGNGQGGTLVATYDYRDEANQLLFEVVRFDATDPTGRFRQRRPDGNGGWIWNTKGVRTHVLYRLGQLIEAPKAGWRILVCEGERDANTALTLGFAATTMPGGVGKWRAEYNHYFQGADVVVVSDNDPQARDPKTGAPQCHADGRPVLPGQDHAACVVRHLRKVAAHVRQIIFPQKDLTAWKEAGGTKAALQVMIDSSPELVRLPPEPEPEPEPDDQLGPLDDRVAEIFAQDHHNDLRYVAAWGKWFEWKGGCWRDEKTLRVFDLLRSTIRTLNVANSPVAKLVSAGHALARADRRLAATIEQWDVDPWLFNTPDGIVERSADYMTLIAAVGPRGDCPRWRAFLDTIFDHDAALIAYLQRVCGYCLTGDTSEQALFFGYGGGNNGKGVFLQTIGGILGDYCKTAAIETFTETKTDRHPTELARLHNVRLVTATETEQGRNWAESRIKMLTGGDVVTARFMRQDDFEYVPKFKLFISGNHKPGFRSVGEAMRRRVNLIPFAVTIAKPDRDQGLVAKLKDEWSGILQWMMEGCIDWLEHGLAPPEAVAMATEAYFVAQDSFSMWLEECCERDPNAWTRTTALFASWKAFAERAGLRHGNVKDFGESLEAADFTWKHTENGNGYEGLRIASDAPPAAAWEVRG
jgi:putative DNA primase/helicase